MEERPSVGASEQRPSLSPTDVTPSASSLLRGPDGIVASLLLNGAAPYVTYQLLTRTGTSSVRALVLTAVFPVLGLLVQAARTRRVDGIALLSLVLITIGVAGTLISNDPRWYLVRVSFGTAAFAVICLGSLLARRPLLFYLGRAVVARDAQCAAYYNSLWAFPGFRRLQRVLTVTWGVGYLLEAAARVAIAVSLPTNVVLLLEPLLNVGLVIALVAWTVRYTGGNARAAEAQAQAQEI